MSLKGKNIVLGVASSVAIYKALELTRLFKKQGAEVHVFMTAHATELVSPQLFQAVSGNPVHHQMFDRSGDDSMPHLQIMKAADVVVLAPATASIIGRYATGLADDLLTTALLATRAPVLIAPAMNEAMYLHSIVQENLKRLRHAEVSIIEPVKGELACGIYAVGHLAPLESILLRTEQLMTPQDLKGKKFLITAGRTAEPIDPVRCLTNYSSGKMGLALVREALLRGAEVTLISGKMDVDYIAHENLEIDCVKTAGEMRIAVLDEFEECDFYISAAAISDFRPYRVSDVKLKKTGDGRILKLVENRDILKEVVKMKRSDQIVIGFGLESGDLTDLGEKKRRDKGVDILVANSPQMINAEEGEFVLISDREQRSIRGTKSELACNLLNTLT
ncbi:bifunctional phosphopantothenoylcysteine decarboxylase/phosphopantothenate--cysteine ligase CoaBC [Candidatus Peregrinibacteria bacterium]|jgi:phosphopantothenoylcysteine decarboxylase / phosphopantothenate---cysteine ligase|nr:bifunctional phosphopantothenoylcysteine decarboxylase/phosphopantothenate--cysteine ligase CoaBC [Candidatus Peregrinibacteria bacterium]MBT7703576.1 bifunctional phosphopantothenoylcysteine decarboxylase/phosphopantothenate--cysteine ligase CoaBC [Candidatus Peregrinibacteria bacterium]